VIDSFNNPATDLFLSTSGSGVGGPTTQTISTGGILGTINRTTTLSTTRLVAPNRTNDLTIGDGVASLALANNHSGSATLEYAFSNFDFSSRPLFAFNYGYDQATTLAPITFTFRLTGSSLSSLGGSVILSQNFTTGVGVNGQQIFNFGSYDLTSISSARLVIQGANANDIDITSPITANAVPVPPAVLATGIGAAIAAVKTRKQQAEAVAV
jgi:hypothetical protein